MRWLLFALLLVAGCAHSIDRRCLARIDTLVVERGKHGEGSAVVVDPAGVLLTAAHVVDGADDVYVTLSDGRQLVAEVTRCDAKADVAELQVDAAGLVALPRAASEPAAGDVVRAYGRHAGGGAGRVTAVDPSAAEGDRYLVDAPFGPGDSGGALVNAQGELVGILLGGGVGGRGVAAWPPPAHP